MSTYHRSSRHISATSPDFLDLPEIFFPNGAPVEYSDKSKRFTSVVRSAHFIASPLCRKLVDLDSKLKTPAPYTLIKGTEAKLLFKKYGSLETSDLLDTFADDHQDLITLSVSAILADTDKQGRPKLKACLDEDSLERLHEEFIAAEDFLKYHGAKPFEREGDSSTINLMNFENMTECSHAQRKIMNFLEHADNKDLVVIGPAQLELPQYT